MLNDINKLMDELNLMIEHCENASEDPCVFDMVALIHNLDTEIKQFLRPLMRKLKKEYKEAYD